MPDVHDFDADNDGVPDCVVELEAVYMARVGLRPLLVHMQVCSAGCAVPRFGAQQRRSPRAALGGACADEGPTV